MRQTLLVFLLAGIMFGILYILSLVVYPLIGVQEIVRPVAETLFQDTSLDQYAIENLRIRNAHAGIISFDEEIDETSSYSTYGFSYYADGKKVTGLAHIPNETEDASVIVMFRGYVDREIYEPGIGTSRAGEMFAQNGFITLAPDFLGYGGSDMPSEDPMEERFERYAAGLTLLDAVPRLDESLERSGISTTVDEESVGLWGHSNGGHIALVMLEATGADYPTTLWAPVTKPFPYSILYYTDEFDDYGKALRKLVAGFEEEYDVDRYSLTTYLDWINAPIQLHQGGADDAVPQDWSDEFAEKMEELEKDITYYTYPGADHNLMPAWNTVVARDLRFFREVFEE